MIRRLDFSLSFSFNFKFNFEFRVSPLQYNKLSIVCLTTESNEAPVLALKRLPLKGRSVSSSTGGDFSAFAGGGLFSTSLKHVK